MGNNNNDDQHEFNRWRGGIDVLVKNHTEALESHARRLDSLDDKVRDVITKLAVPLFLVGISGPVVGALIVWAITKR